MPIRQRHRRRPAQILQIQKIKLWAALGAQEPPGWWLAIRRVVTFFLGVAVIVDSLAEKNSASVGKLLVGLLLIGVLPVDDIVRLYAVRRGRQRED
jgi:hypothetical protein